MTKSAFLDTGEARRIAYHKTKGQGPCVVFLGGFKSDMNGTKAIYLEAWAKRVGRGFLRFDYSGHGESSGRFVDGAIGDWAEDAIGAISALTTGKVILVGSSMGGWISLLVARAIPSRIAGLVGIAAAPDFTADDMWEQLNAEQRQVLNDTGQVALASDYSDEPYIITKRLIEDGARHLVLRSPLNLPFPARFLQGTADEDVSVSVAMRLLDHARGEDIRLTLVKGADHRFSTSDCLRLIQKTIHSVTMAAQK
ncbi:MAG: alpha/beta hydrolase [Alphaproteobacteria bacterium]|nr:alpha/beta hydrolase [Alphaproteobacteria bacterium]